MDHQVTGAMNMTPHARKAKRLLEAADARLASAHQALTAESPQYGTAAAQLVEVTQTGLRAFLTWHGRDGMGGAPLSIQAERAVSLASILRTFVRRARRLVPVADRLQDGDDTSFSIEDREAVLEGFYATRNFYFTLRSELPPAMRPAAKLAPDSNLQSLEDAPATVPAS